MDERLISLNAAIKTAHLPVIDDAGYEVVRVDDILALPSVQLAQDLTKGCTDTISRVAAISICDNAIDLWNGQLGTGALVAVRDAIMALPSAQPRWIPTSERLPDVRQWVLCQCRAGIMDVLRLTADGSWNKNYPHTEYMSGFVVAWMPLPAPWEGGRDETDYG